MSNIEQGIMNVEVRKLYSNHSPTKYTKEHEKKIIFVFFRVFCGLSPFEIPCSIFVIHYTVKLIRNFNLALMGQTPALQFPTCSG